MKKLMTLESFTYYVSEMNDEFDSHDLINCILQHNAKEYLAEIPHKMDSKVVESFRTLNSSIANFLKHNAERLKIEELEEQNSIDVFGNESPCKKWRKTNR